MSHESTYQLRHWWPFRPCQTSIKRALQFIDIVNLAESLLHFFRILYSVGSGSVLSGPKVWWNECRCLTSHPRRLIVSRGRAISRSLLRCWKSKIKNSSEISRMTASSFWVRSNSLIFTPASTNIRYITPTCNGHVHGVAWTLWNNFSLSWFGYIIDQKW